MDHGIRSYGYVIGTKPTGAGNRITDVPGVRVGQVTIDNELNKTGVTVIMPACDNVFLNKMTAASYVLNGYGKTAGLVQVNELGTLETPIALTNTLNVGLVHDALVEYTIQNCKGSGVFVRSVNPVVGETNDARINHIQHRAIGYDEVRKAIDDAEKDFTQGDVGAGKGTICFGLKGGIGSSSRVLTFDGKEYTLGVLVQSNFGATRNLVINGRPVGQDIIHKIEQEAHKDEGSIMVIMACDLPLTNRQLHRTLKRAAVGLARTGSMVGHGSGDIILGFTTKNRIPHTKEAAVMNLESLHEDCMDQVFEAMIECVEESVLNSMVYAHAAKGVDGTVIHSLAEYL